METIVMDSGLAMKEHTSPEKLSTNWEGGGCAAHFHQAHVPASPGANRKEQC